MRFLRLARNKYLVTVVALACWLVFFDKNDVFTQYELIQKCNRLEEEKAYYQEEIISHRKQLHELKTNAQSLETFSREKYLMKRQNEDVFVFVAE